MASVVVFSPIKVNGMLAGWEGRRFEGGEGDAVIDLVRSANAEVVSGLLPSMAEITAFWDTSYRQVQENRAREQQKKIDQELWEANQLTPLQAGLSQRGRIVSQEG